MAYYEQIPVHNDTYAATYDKGDLPMPPGRKVIIVACMDARIEPASQLGIKIGEAHVIRNAGGLAADAMRNIVISQRLLGTREIAIFQHTDCGMFTFTNDSIRDQIKEEENGNAEVSAWVDKTDFLPFKDLEKSVKDDVKFLKESPLVLKETLITGWTYDVKTGKVARVV